MSSIQEGILAISHEPANHPIVKRFFRFAAALAVIPIFIYVVVSQIVRRVTTAKTGFFSPPILGGLAAVFTINVVMGIFALLAVKERMPSPPAASANVEVEEEEEDVIIEDDESNHAKTE